MSEELIEHLKRLAKVGFGYDIKPADRETLLSAAAALSLAPQVKETPAPSSHVAADWKGREGCVGAMTPSRAVYFLERFKREEKMLGPHEQWALDFAIAALSTAEGSTDA